MMLLADFVKHDEFLFLLTLLNLNYADYDYEIDPTTLNVNNQIVTVEFISKPSTLRYVNIQKNPQNSCCIFIFDRLCK